MSVAMDGVSVNFVKDVVGIGIIKSQR